MLPHSDRPVTAIERGLFRRIPGAQRLVRAVVYALRELLVLGLTVDRRIMKLPEMIGRRHLRSQVAEREADSLHEQTDAVRRQVMENLKQVYFRLAYIQQTLGTLERNDQLLNQVREVAHLVKDVPAATAAAIPPPVEDQG